jgi:hypothetical protein
MSPVHSYTRSSFLDLVISRVRAFARIGPRAGVGGAGPHPGPRLVRSTPCDYKNTVYARHRPDEATTPRAPAPAPGVGARPGQGTGTGHGTDGGTISAPWVSQCPCSTRLKEKHPCVLPFVSLLVLRASRAPLAAAAYNSGDALDAKPRVAGRHTPSR